MHSHRGGGEEGDEPHGSSGPEEGSEWKENLWSSWDASSSFTSERNRSKTVQDETVGPRRQYAVEHVMVLKVIANSHGMRLIKACVLLL